MSTESTFYVGYKVCGCPVAAVNADVAGPQELAESLAEMIQEGYRVEKTAGLPRAFVEETCSHKAKNVSPDPPPTCRCGELLTEREIHDSTLVGTLLRCRDCLERVGLVDM